MGTVTSRTNETIQNPSNMLQAARYEAPDVGPPSTAPPDYRFVTGNGAGEEIYENMGHPKPTPNVVQYPAVPVPSVIQSRAQPIQSGTAPKLQKMNSKITCIFVLIVVGFLVNLILAGIGIGFAIESRVRIDKVEDRVDLNYNLIRNYVNNLTNIRLVGGTPRAGRVEILHDGVWGTVCDDEIDYDAGNLMCRLLGFSYATNMICCAAYGEGTGQIWLDNLRCDGDENVLDQCYNVNWGVHDCQHSEDLSISCA